MARRRDIELGVTCWSSVQIRSLSMVTMLTAALVSGCAPALRAPRTTVTGRDSVRVAPVARGIVHETHWMAAGPWVAQVVRVDLAQCRCALEAMHAFDGIRGRERVSDMATRFAARGTTVLAAINADFFDLRTGDVENNQVVAGEWTKGNGISESPHHTFPTVHVQVGQREDGRVVIGRFRMRGVVRVGGDSMVVEALNPQRRGNGAIVLYSARHGERTPVSGGAADSGAVQVDPDNGPATPERVAAAARRDSLKLAADTAARSVVEVPLEPVETPGVARSGRHRYRVSGLPQTGTGGTRIPKSGLVLSITLDDVATMRASRLVFGREVTLELDAVDLGGTSVGPVRALVGGWGALVDDGANISARVDSLEGTFPRFSAQRHPRTAVGLARGGRELLLIGVDGRGANGSAGMSLVELGGWLVALGVRDGANLDGGGSTTVWIMGRGVVNRPSDPTGERPVGNGLFVVRR
ncbi:MAG: phosphodiester glycosidase family protein [Gemmatimonadaceae bacterium]|nr:phosphodiester glycosidase family protein [Gemmatimonadaceae bacterium]